MQVVEVTTKKEQKKFIAFRRKLYKRMPLYVDNNLFMLKEVFAKRTSFIDNKQIFVFNVEEENEVVCQGIVLYTQDLKEYIQLCFFESLSNQEEAVKLLVEKALEIGRQLGCEKLVIGLNGHVNYGLGFLDSHFDTKNTFSASVNPEYYNQYFRDLECEEVVLNTYKMHVIDNRIERYRGILNKINKNYTFQCFDKKRFNYFAKIYTDLNNSCFTEHRYYYKRNYQEDIEMLKELFLFMKEESLIFAFDGDRPVGFILWYPDFNELVKPGDYFGTKHFFKNLLFYKQIKTIKVMEYGILDEYRKVGLPIGLLNQIFETMKGQAFTSVETSWILDENKDSNSVCQAVCDELYKRYVVYEKRI